ncbi:hypothetical protein HYX09_03150 [Candidatus Woesearchaeota archaeon]|nr:hypothetical protein [Candidatus Woesearchaeota archaeon]
MKRITNLLLLSATLSIFIIIMSAQANAEKEIYAGKVFTNNRTIIDNVNFTFVYDPGSDKALASFPDGTVIVSRGECETRDPYRICFDSANWSSRDYAAYVDTYEIGVRISRTAPELAIKRTLSPPALLQGEKGLITVKIENPGNSDVTDVIYKDDFSMFQISGLTGCELKDGSIYWKGSIKLLSSKECSFYISASQKMDAAIVAALTYNNGFATVNATSSSLAISVREDQLKAASQKQPGLEPGISFTYSLIVENLNTEQEMDVTSSTQLPSFIKVKKKPEQFWASGNELGSTFKLKPKQASNFTFTLQAENHGIANITSRFDYYIQSLKDTLAFYDNLSIKDTTPEVSVLLSTETPKPNEKFVASVTLRNPSSQSNLEDVEAVLLSGFSEPIKNSINSLKANQSYNIISNTLMAPADIDEKPRTLELKITYAFSGKKYSIERSIPLRKAVEAAMVDNNMTASLEPGNASITLENLSVQAGTQLPDFQDSSAQSRPANEPQSADESKSETANPGLSGNDNGNVAEDLAAGKTEKDNGISEKTEAAGVVAFSPSRILLLVAFIFIIALITLNIIFRAKKLPAITEESAEKTLSINPNKKDENQIKKSK